MTISLFERFTRCVAGPWFTAGKDVQYRVNREGPYAYVAFEYTDANSVLDIIADANAWPTLKRELKRQTYLAMKGVDDAYESVKAEILGKLAGAMEVLIEGHSLGGAMATRLHRDVYEGITQNVSTYTFGGFKQYLFPDKALRYSFARLYRVVVRGDIVTWWPFFYSNVGQKIAIGPFRLIPRWKYHAHYGKILAAIGI